MVYGKHVQIGRVVLLNDCEDRGKICAIVEIIDANRIDDRQPEDQTSCPNQKSGFFNQHELLSLSNTAHDSNMKEHATITIAYICKNNMGLSVVSPYRNSVGSQIVSVSAKPNQALIDGPCTGVKRQPMQFKHMHLTKWVLPILHGARTKTVQKAWDTAKITNEWEQSAIFKKLKMQETRAKLTDYDRFKLMKAKQMRNRLINVEYVKLRKAHNKTPPKPKNAKKAKKSASK